MPVATLNRVAGEDFSWNVPGLREELVTSLIRSLPKHLRVSFLPAPHTAREFLAAVPAGEEPLLDALERHLRATRGVVVPREAWDSSKVADHLRPTYRVVDDSGQEQARGKDLERLKEPLRPQFAQALREVAGDSGLARTGETTWTFNTLEGTHTSTCAGHEVTAYPGLVDEGSTVGLAVAGSADERDARHRRGVARLLLLAVPDPGVLDGLSNAEKLGLAGSPYPSVASLMADCRLAVVLEQVDARPPVRDEATYAALLAEVRVEHGARLRALVSELLRVLEVWRSTDRLLSGRAPLPLLPALSDMQSQVAGLVRPGFVSEAGPEQLRRYPTYLAAVRHRRERLDEGGPALARDREWQDRITDLQEAYLHRVTALPLGRPPGEGLRQVRWLLEELRVSLWAQHLGTARSVSDARVRAALDQATSPPT